MGTRHSSILSLFAALRRDEVLGVRHNRLCTSALSPNDNPSIQHDIKALGGFLYQQLAVTGLQYEAVSSIPSGGDQYTDVLVKLAKKDGKKLERLVLKRDGHQYPQRIVNKGEVKMDRRLLLIDDSIWTGETMEQATRLVESAGYTIVAYLCIADLHYEESRTLHLPVISVFNSNLVDGNGRR